MDESEPEHSENDNLDLVRQTYTEYLGEELKDLHLNEQVRGYRKELVIVQPSIFSKLKHIIHVFVNDERSSWLARGYHLFTIAVILMAVVLVIVESWPSIYNGGRHSTTFFLLETFIVVVFVTDYVLRLISATNPLKYMFSFFGIIDILSIIPYYIALIVYLTQGDGDNSFVDSLRVLRAVRIVRLLKIGRFIGAVNAVGKAMWSSLADILGLLMLFVTAVIVFSTLEYFAEQTQADFIEDPGCIVYNPDTLQCWVYNEDSNSPGKLSPYQSIAHSMWWAVCAMTTVGYGDTVPITPLGKFTAALAILIGLLAIALPGNILLTKFNTSLKELRFQQENEEYRAKHTRNIIDVKLNDLEKEIITLETEIAAASSIYNDIANKQQKMVQLVDHSIAKFTKE